MSVARPRGVLRAPESLRESPRRQRAAERHRWPADMPKGHLHPTQEHCLDSTFPNCKGCKAPRKQRMAAWALWHQSARPSGLSSRHPVPAPCASSPQAATLPVSVPTAASRHVSTSSPSPAQLSLVSLQLPDCTTNGPHNKASLPADCSPQVSSDVH